MKTKHKFNITEFADFARTTRNALLHYENLGLITPVSRNEGNNYRQYTYSQLAIINLIHTCQFLGMSLLEIQDLVKQRTPAIIDKLLERQINDIDRSITDWSQSRKLLCILRETIRSVRDVDESAISILWMPKQGITLGDQNDYSGERDDYDALDSFYQTIRRKYPKMDMNYSVWGMFSEERVRSGDWRWPDRYYFNDPDGPDEKAASLYAVGYKRGGYGQSAELYEQMLEYIDGNGFVICGPAYEEYPLNEICIADDKNYLMRVMITIRQR